MPRKCGAFLILIVQFISKFTKGFQSRPRISFIGIINSSNKFISGTLTRREQEIPLFYKWWDELRLTRRFLDFWGLLYYNIFINQSYLT